MNILSYLKETEEEKMNKCLLAAIFFGDNLNLQQFGKVRRFKRDKRSERERKGERERRRSLGREKKDIKIFFCCTQKYYQS